MRAPGVGSQPTVEKPCSQAGQKGPRGEAREKPTSGGVLEHYVGVRRGKRRNGREEGPNPTLTALVEVPPPSPWTLKQRWAHFIKQVYEGRSPAVPAEWGSMRIITLIDQASVYAYPREALTVVGTFTGSANQGVYWISCTGVPLRECRLHFRNLHLFYLTANADPPTLLAASRDNSLEAC